MQYKQIKMQGIHIDSNLFRFFLYAPVDYSSDIHKQF